MERPHATSGPNDAIPGSPDAVNAGREAFVSYLVGFGIAAALTLASFGVTLTHLVWAPSAPVLLAALAIAQMGIHLVFFFHISSSPDATNNILALAFGVFVVGLVVFGSMVIMHNLDMNMMSTEQLMQMQR